MAASVEDLARSSMENLIKELHNERQVSNKERSLKEKLITLNQEREAAIKDLRNLNHQMSEQIEKLKDIINKYKQNKDGDKASDSDIKDEGPLVAADTIQSDEQSKDSDKASDSDIKEEDASEVAVAKEAIAKADTMDGDDSKYGGTDAAAITISESVSEDSELSVAKVEVTEEKKDSESSGPELNKIPMNERRRFLIQVIMILRFTFRGYFGPSFANRWGHWWDRYLSTQVSEYGYWLVYPDGHHVLKGHSDAVYAAAVSSDGRFLFTAQSGGSIIVWDLLDYSMLKQFGAFDKVIYCLNYESDLLVSAGTDTKIRVFNGITHDLVRTMEGHSDTVKSVQFNKSFDKIVSCSDDKSVRIWSVEKGDCLVTLTGHTSHVYSAYFMDNDTKVISASEDGSIKVWKMNDTNECDAITDGSYDDMSVNCDSSLVACFYMMKGVIIYNWPNMDIVRSMGESTRKCWFHPTNPDILAVIDYASRSVKIYNVRSGDMIAEWKGHTSPIKGLCWSRDGFLLVSVGSDGTARVWNGTGLI